MQSSPNLFISNLTAIFSFLAVFYIGLSIDKIYDRFFVKSIVDHSRKSQLHSKLVKRRLRIIRNGTNNAINVPAIQWIESVFYFIWKPFVRSANFIFVRNKKITERNIEREFQHVIMPFFSFAIGYSVIFLFFASLLPFIEQYSETFSFDQRKLVKRVIPLLAAPVVVPVLNFIISRIFWRKNHIGKGLISIITYCGLILAVWLSYNVEQWPIAEKYIESTSSIFTTDSSIVFAALIIPASVFGVISISLALCYLGSVIQGIFSALYAWFLRRIVRDALKTELIS